MELPLPLRAERHADVGAQVTAERILHPSHFRGRAHPFFQTRSSLGHATAADAVLDLPDRESLRDGFAGEVRDDAWIIETEQRAGVTDGEVPLVQHGEHHVGKLQEPERVRDRGPVAAHRFGDILLGQEEFGDQPLVAPRFVDGREVVALEVLDQRKRQDRPVVDVACDGRDLLPPQGLAGPEAALTGDQLEAAGTTGGRADHHRLHQTHLLDRGLQLLEGRGVDVLPGLERVGFDVGNQQLAQAALTLRLLACRSEERLESAT